MIREQWHGTMKFQKRRLGPAALLEASCGCLHLTERGWGRWVPQHAPLGNRCGARPPSRPQGAQGCWLPTPADIPSGPSVPRGWKTHCFPPSIATHPFPRRGLLQSIPACQTSWGHRGPGWCRQPAGSSHSSNSKPGSTLQSTLLLPRQTSVSASPD